MNHLTHEHDPKRRRLWLSLALIGCLVVVALGAYLGWALVRHKTLVERSPQDIKAIVAREIGAERSPLGVQAALLRAGFEHVGIEEGGSLVWGVATPAPARFTIVERQVRVHVMLGGEGAPPTIVVTTADGRKADGNKADGNKADRNPAKGR